jgi:N-acetylglucosamine-6-phosphate deacetylase
MIVLAGAELVLPDRLQSPGTLLLDGDRIVEVIAGTRSRSAGAASDDYVDLHDRYIVPGFIDVHVHGVERADSLDGPAAVGRMASRLPKYGVTAFCPTTVACAPDMLRQILSSVREMKAVANPSGSRVLAAHLESNFINPDFRGAQPESCLRSPRGRDEPRARMSAGYDACDILKEIERAGSDVGIVTLAPELDGGFELIKQLVGNGTRVSLGHSGATFEQASEAIALGARQATHLFNRMPPLGHRDPGLVGAVLTSNEIAAELICDGVHVHPAMLRLAIAAKRPERLMAITDGTALAGLPEGSHASLGGRRITLAGSAAYLDDGTLAGSVATMDRVFRFLVNQVGVSFTDAAKLCATTPATELGLAGVGAISPGAIADITVLDRRLTVKQTFVAGRCVYQAQ